MSNPYPGVPASGERWNVNMPAVIGVVFVFLVGVIVWVLVSGQDGDDDAAAPSTTSAETVPVSDAAGTTTPAPMPSVPPSTDAVAASTAPSSTSTTTSSTPSTSSTSSTSTTSSTSPTTVPVTAAESAGPDAVAGDLGVPGQPMSKPGCDGSYITVLASAIGTEASAVGIGDVLDAYPGSNYLRTDQTCPSLTPDVDGEPIYVVFFGPFAFDSDACSARADGPEGAYARMLSQDVGPDHTVACA